MSEDLNAKIRRLDREGWDEPGIAALCDCKLSDVLSALGRTNAQVGDGYTRARYS